MVFSFRIETEKEVGVSLTRQLHDVVFIQHSKISKNENFLFLIEWRAKVHSKERIFEKGFKSDDIKW